MTDREMLELAAKAAGILLCGYSWIGENEDDDECEILESAFVKTNPEQELATKWNPLTDDGDALRLAVRLHMQVSVTTESCRAETLPRLGVRVNDSDENLATRRAVVMAAAAVGRETK